ncbi:MAG: hypothetical protein AAB510_00645 [Patescibacteria group bacterium]
MEKIKSFLESDRGKNILLIFIIIFMAISSFELGRISKSDQTSGVKITETIEEYSVANTQPADVLGASKSLVEAKNTTIRSSSTPKIVEPKAPAPKDIYFASKRGKKYYPLGCSAGKTIKQENRIYYDNRGEAEAAGYELSSSCR